MLSSKKTPSFLAWSCVMLGLSNNLGAVLPEETEARATPKATASANTAPADDDADKRKVIDRKCITLKDHKDLTKVELGSDDVDVHELDLSGTNVFDLRDLPQYAHLTRLILKGCNNPALDFSTLPQCEALRLLDLSGITGNLDLTFLKACNLETLYIQDRDDLTDLNFLAGCTGIKHLSVAGKKLKTLDGIGALANLEALQVSSGALTTLDGLAQCQNLTYVSVNSDTLGNVHALQNHPSLQHATISPFPGTNLEAFKGCTNLESLRLRLCRHLETLNGFKGENIHSLHIETDKLKNIAAASLWPKLETFYLKDIHRSGRAALVPLMDFPNQVRFYTNRVERLPIEAMKNKGLPAIRAAGKRIDSEKTAS